QIQVDTTAATTAISCNGGTCATGWYNAPVRVTLSATDNTGGSGVGATLYTTDGSDPKTSPTATAYTGPFTVSQSATVKYHASDTAGHSENVTSQLIQTDTTAPASSTTCNSAACSACWYKTGPVTVALSATDNAAGSGVTATYYTTSGSTPTTSSTEYTGPFTV